MTRSSRWRLGLSAALLRASAAAAATAAPAPLTAEQKLELGQAIVDRNCGMRHATGTTGSSHNPEAPPFRLLNQKIDVDDLSEALAEGILTDHVAMPEFRFEPREIDATIHDLKSIQTRARE